MNTDTLNILTEALESASWQWWEAADEIFQVEFWGALLYDETRAEKDSHTSTIALRFQGNLFAVFFDNFGDEQGKKWYERFHDDEIEMMPVEMDQIRFDDPAFAMDLFGAYANVTPMQNYSDAHVFSSAKHILAVKCPEAGFVVGGDAIQVIGSRGRYSEADILAAAERWWAYWRDYWRLRGTPDAYKKDWGCEITIPFDPEEPQGRLFDEGKAE